MDKFIGIAICGVILCGMIFVIRKIISENKGRKNYFILYKKYLLVQVGATKSEVLFKLGKPQQIRKADKNRVLWIYSLSYKKRKKVRFTLLFEEDVVISQSDIYHQ